MTDTITTSTATSAATTQNYILYRTTARMYQPGYGYNAGDTPVVPAAQVSTAAGTVIATQQLSSLTGVTAPAGFAYALDTEGKYPVGSTYTPTAAATS